MRESLEILCKNGWSHDKLSVLLATSRPSIKAILNGEKPLGALEARLVDAVARKCPQYKEFNKRAMEKEILRYVEEEL